MTYQLTGRLSVVFDTKKINDRFQKRELILETKENPDYPQHVTFQLTGDRCGIIDSFNIGDELTLSFNLRGKEWKNPEGGSKYFNSLDVWKIEIPTKEFGSRENIKDEDRFIPDDEPPF